MSKEEILISIDIETNGAIPGKFSMLSLGAAAFNYSGKLLSTFSVNMETLPNATEDPDTMIWWSKNEKAYADTRLNIINPKLAMEQFVDWTENLGGTPVVVGYPIFFDYLFVYWYLIHFTGKSPFSFSALDIKTYAMAILKTDYRQSTKKNMPKHWFSDAPHTHNALEDAIEQGQLFCNMLKENLNKK